MDRGPAPQELTDYQLERAFWVQLGINAERLMFWPQERIERYVTVMNAVAKFEEAEQRIARQRAEAEQRGKTKRG